MNWLLVLAFIFTSIFLVNQYLFSYWTRRNVPQVTQTFFVGNLKELFTLKVSACDVFSELYEKSKNKPYFGAYFSYKPILIINDPELVQSIIVRDFNVFHDRVSPAEGAKRYALLGSLFSLKGKKWRDLRHKLSPAFSLGKIKLMIPVIRNSGRVLEEYIQKSIKNGKRTLDFKDLFARLTMNNISTIVFGVDNDCINQKDNEFYKKGLKIFETTLRNMIVFFCSFCMPDLLVKSRINPFHPDVTNLIYSLVNQTIDFRKENNFRRNDLIQSLIDLKDHGYVSLDKDSRDEIESRKEQKSNKSLSRLTIDDIAAQSFIFFGAGYETSSSTMTFCLFELSRNKTIQKKVQEEIDMVMKLAGPEGITYDLLNEMKYLDCCIYETLRKYPVTVIIFRESNMDYNLPGTDVVIEKGTGVFIPVIGIQRDPNIYEDPLAFKPERFLNSQNGDPKIASGIVYMPFGDGPRKCIGERLGKLQSKLGLAMILQKFNCELQDKSLMNRELTFNPKSFLLSPIEKISVNVSLRD